MLPGRPIAFSSHADLADTSERNRLSVIQISRDGELSRLRAKVLAAAGHSVLTVTPEDLISGCSLAGANRIWIFCHTVECNEMMVIAGSIRRVRPGDRLVRMTGLEELSHAHDLFEESLDPTTGVDGLLRALAQLSTP